MAMKREEKRREEEIKGVPGTLRAKHEPIYSTHGDCKYNGRACRK
jgi:hypothetical protein